MAFENTIDKYGDEATMDMIIERTIDEYCDNSATKIGQYAFYGCTALTKVDLPNVVTVGNNAFQNSAITVLSIPKVTEIKGSAFYGCASLTEIDLPVVTTIGGAAFQNCSSLSRINIPMATAVQDGAFHTCKALTYVDFPLVSALRASVFSTCSLLETLILRRTSGVVTMANTNALSNTPIASGTGYVYVPKALVDSYKAATNWSTYAAQIRAIEDYPEITGG